MHNRLDLCQEAKLMKVWGRGVTMEHGSWSIQAETQRSKLQASVVLVQGVFASRVDLG